MKTSNSIEEQEARKDARGEGDSPRASTQPVSKKKRHGDFSRIAAWAWKPGQSGNPTGGGRHDLSATIAREVFENNADALYKAFTKALKRGNAYAYKELSDRAYGKLKERHEVDVHPYRELTDEQIRERVAELERQLGYSSPEPQILPPADGSKPD